MGPAGPLRVLLVDDHALVRQGIASFLATCRDIEVVGEGGDGLQAIAKARDLTPDLILMDIQMPGMDGLEATRRIKAAHPSLKIVMLTVAEDDQSLFEAVKAGAYGYLLKSTQPEDFLARVRGISQRREPRAEKKEAASSRQRAGDAMRRDGEPRAEKEKAAGSRQMAADQLRTDGEPRDGRQGAAGRILVDWSTSFGGATHSGFEVQVTCALTVE